MNKIAATLKQILKGIDRKRMIRTPSKINRDLLDPIGVYDNPSPAGIARDLKKRTAHSIRQNATSATGEPLPDHIVQKATEDSIKPVKSFVGKYLSPRGHNPSDIMYEAAYKTPKSGKERALSNAVVLRHELDETKKWPLDVNFASQARHNSPGVILKEHNLVRSLKGKEGKRVRKMLSDSRTIREQPYINANMKDLGFHYGKSERLSRHAIKRIAEALAQTT